MKFTFALLVIVAILGCAFSCSEEEFDEYKKQFNKNYPDPEENQRHMETYCKAILRIAEHNKDFEEGKVSWSMGVNQFTDLTRDEFRNSGAVMRFN